MYNNSLDYMPRNFCLLADSYKAGHSKLYNPDVTHSYAYFESRGGKYSHTLFFGLQYYLMEYLEGKVIESWNPYQAAEFWDQHFGREDYFEVEKWISLYEDYNGRLPLKIKAVPEGTLVDTHNVLFTCESTDPKYHWLVGYVETLLMKMWYPITIATQSYSMKDGLRAKLEMYSDNLDGLPFMVHDFGYRGCTSEEQAALGGAAHLLSFKGTDTIAGIRLLQSYYDEGSEEEKKMYGFSVPASEHSIILSFGMDHEEAAFERMLDLFPHGIIACVSDTFDIDQAVNGLWGVNLHDKVLARDGVLVIRPDSGDPNLVVQHILEDLEKKFGAERNTKGLKVINPKVRVIQGDGMREETIHQLYSHVMRCGFAPDNLVVGAGGGMLQGVNRDTQRFAYKTSYFEAHGHGFGVAKRPKDDTSKTSKAGRFSLVYDQGSKKYVTTNVGSAYDELKLVFDHGELTNWQSYEEIVSTIDISSQRSNLKLTL